MLECSMACRIDRNNVIVWIWIQGRYEEIIAQEIRNLGCFYYMYFVGGF